MIDFKIDVKYLIYFIISFMFFTVIGTISHEYGHILVAKSYGYETTLHYGSMHSDQRQEFRDLDLYHDLNKGLILSKKPSTEKEIFNSRLNELRRKSFLITIGGPAQTILTGCLGLLILFYRNKKYNFKFIDWFAVFLSLFWLREVFNLVTGIISKLFFNGKLFGGDEVGIAHYLELPKGTISVSLGLIGLFVSFIVIFKFIPKSKRLTFILSGLIGGLSGFYLWYNIFGPKLLPLY